MIEIILTLGMETILVVIRGNNILFGSTSFGARLATIDQMQLSKAGVCKEFPDLKDKEDWKEQAIKRFKDKIKSLKTEREKANYIIHDLKNYGYIPRKIKIDGSRSINIK